MKPSDVFGIVVRTIGLCVSLLGGLYILGFLLLAVGMLNLGYHGPPTDYLVYGLGFVIAGSGLLRGAPWIVSFGYPSDSNLSENQDHERKES